MSDAPLTDDFSSTIGAQAIGLAGAALLVDAAIETVWAGSPVRWWAVGAAGLYLAAGVVMWRMRVSWQQQLGAIGLAVFGLLATAAWWPGGLTDGVRLLRQPTGTVLSSATLVALLVAAVVLLRESAIPLAARAVATLLAIYGVAAFALGAWQATAYPALFNGASLWQAAPRWLQGSVLGGAVALPLALLVSLARGLRRGEQPWRPQQVVALGLAVVMVVSGFTTAAGVGQGGVTLTSAAAPTAGPTSSADSAPQAPPDAASIATMREATENFLASAPTSDFDVDQKAAALGPDVNGLFAFVRDNIHQQIYAGVLRGARGSLISRAGNAWDKSLLLGALLRHHGREVRFAHGHLTPDRATALVTRMFDQARQPAPVPAVDVPASVVARSRNLVARIEARWRSAQSDLMGALDRGGVSLGQNPSVTEAMLSDEATDHPWVEYRDGDRWVPLDPSGAGQPGEAITTATETFAEIPAALHHRVTFRVKVEERRNQALTERDAFIWPTTAGALHGAHVIFTHQIGQTPLGRWRATPMLLVDQQAYGALSFTDAGLEIPAKVSNALVGEASRQVQGVGRINELFGSPAPPAQPTASNNELTGVWLEFEFTDPSGRSEIVRREILDRIGAVARAQGAVGTATLAPLTITSGVPIAFAGLYACAVTAGPLHPRLGLERLAPSFSAIDDVLTLQKLGGSGTATIPPEEQPRLRRVVESLPALLESTAQGIHLLSQRLASQIRTTGDTPLFYEATPRLAIVSLDPAASTLAVDLRRNALRVVARGGQGQDIARANLARGVLDGVIEDALAEQALAGVPNAVPVSAVAILSRARAEGIPIIAGSGRGALAALTVPDVARARLAAVLERPRQVVVAPARAPSVASTPRFAWWQVDGETGDTIGVLDSGLLGAQLTDDAALADTVALPGARALGAGAASGAGFITITLTAKDALIVGIGLGILISGVTFFVAATILSAK